MSRDSRITAINESAREYFASHKSEDIVSARDLFFSSARMQAAFSSDKTMRTLLRSLRDNGTICHDIPGIHMEQKQTNTNWYIMRTAGAPITVPTQKKQSCTPAKQNASVPASVESIDKALLDPKAFVSISSLESSKDLDCTGMYCIKLRLGSVLPSPYNGFLKPDRILYIGKTSATLRSRFLGQELNAEGHGTFFRSCGAMLGYLPPKGSLNSGRNYKFSPADEESIRKWLRINTIVNCVPVSTDKLSEVEPAIISKYCPLLNIQHNTAKLDILEAARANCVTIASSK